MALVLLLYLHAVVNLKHEGKTERQITAKTPLYICYSKKDPPQLSHNLPNPPIRTLTLTTNECPITQGRYNIYKSTVSEIVS